MYYLVDFTERPPAAEPFRKRTAPHLDTAFGIALQLVGLRGNARATIARVPDGYRPDEGTIIAVIDWDGIRLAAEEPKKVGG